MPLPDARNWKVDWNSAGKDGEIPDACIRIFIDMCRRVEELEDRHAKTEARLKRLERQA